MDYQRACGITGRAMPQRPRMYQPRQMGCNPGGQIVCMPESEMHGSECCEHLAIVASPMQCWQNLYTPCEALSAGTLFRELNLPLVGCPGSAYWHRRSGGLQ